MDHEMMAPEVKADLTRAYADLMGEFQAFREANDRRLKELESGSEDVVTVETLSRIEQTLQSTERRIEEMVLRSSRPALQGPAEPRNGRRMASQSGEHRSAFDGYVRGGDETGLRQLEKKALTAGASDAGFTVPVEVESEVLTRLAAISPIRSIASVRQVSGSTYKKPVTTQAPAFGWVADADARSADYTTTLTELSIDTMELYAMPAATQTLLDDSAVSIDEWLADEIQTVFAEQETAAFVAGDGNKKPRGITSYPHQIDAPTRPWGTIGVVATGVDGGFDGTYPADALVDLVYTLKAGYRQNAHFLMNRTTQAAVRKMKDTDGSYLWAPPAIPGARATFLNFPVVEAEEMPDIGPDTTPIAFGDFNRGYLIVDRQGLRVLRDPYSAKPYVLFYVTKRVGGGVQDFDAIKLLKLAD